MSNLNELPRDGSERCKVQTDKGAEVEADLVFVCVGMKTNSAAYSQTFGTYFTDHKSRESLYLLTEGFATTPLTESFIVSVSIIGPLL